MAKHALLCSMSGKGNCYDNAVAETFFHILKVEMVQGDSFIILGNMRQSVFGFVEVDFNRTNKPNANGYINLLAVYSKSAD